MARFDAFLCFIFTLGLLSSASMVALAPTPTPISAAPKASSSKSPVAPSPTTASAPSKVVTLPTTTFVPAAQTPASNPLVKGPATTSPPSASSRAVSTACLEKMAIFGAALLGGAAFLL